MRESQPNPILIECVRGPIAESAHRGAVAVWSAGGPVLTIGDVARPVYPRSAIKALQTLPLVESGAADALGLSTEELAVACASHSGADYHVEAVRSLLAKAGLAESDLACGAHMPFDPAAFRAASESGTQPVQNNCSGKHAGMLAACVHLGLPTQGYERPDHPLQVAIRRTISELAGEELAEAPCGIDGCSLPTWGLSLTGLARAFARFGTGVAFDANRAEAASRLMAACFAAPEWVAGEGRLDTLLLRRLRGQAFVKTGAEGVYAASLPRHGLGIALKIDDGAKRAAEAAIVQVLAALLPERSHDLADRIDQEQRNWRGLLTGGIRASESFREKLAEMERRETSVRGRDSEAVPPPL